MGLHEELKVELELRSVRCPRATCGYGMGRSNEIRSSRVNWLSAEGFDHSLLKIRKKEPAYCRSSDVRVGVEEEGRTPI